eukprot:GFUD01018501.1.p1 GENE.GFUD01018501.1~~GFUD01018501.1.p1  ORF type:complete len:282 (-),score=76.08 GFUD01018501.1:43-888(-)
MATSDCSQCSSPLARACICGQAAYCNTACQRADWARHQGLCPLVSPKGRSFIANRTISQGQTILTVAPLLSMDRLEPSCFISLHRQFQTLKKINQQQVLELFEDEDIYKILESPALKDNPSFKNFLLTISLEEFETLMKVIQVMNNNGFLYDKYCLLLPNLTISPSPNCSIEKQDQEDTLVFEVKASSKILRGEEVTVGKNFIKDCGIEPENVNAEDVKVVFKALDCDGDGYLNKTEFVNALNLIKLFNKEEADDLFIKADYDCDGRVGFYDFLKFVRKYK